MFWLGFHQAVYDCSCLIFDQIGVWKTLRVLRFIRYRGVNYVDSAWYQAAFDAAVDTFGETIYDRLGV